MNTGKRDGGEQPESRPANNDLFPDAEIPIEAQIKCVQREIEFRHRVYARRVSQGRMSEVFAEQQIKLMQAVLKTLEEVRNDHLRHRDREGDPTEG